VAFPYATSTELATWLGTAAPANADRLLTIAAHRIKRVIRHALYDTDTDGEATDEDVIAALRDATCAQVQYMTVTGDETGATRGATALSLGAASVSFAAPTDRDGEPGLSDVAADILINAGLTPYVSTRW
jgi:hypothetical protein